MSFSMKALKTYDVPAHVTEHNHHHHHHHHLNQRHYSLSHDLLPQQFSLRSTTIDLPSMVSDHDQQRDAHASYKNGYSVLKPIDPNTKRVAGPHLGRKWPEYQGAGDWAGLLDPLDETLLSEILRYGDFNEAAYRAFDFDTTSPSFGSCKYIKSKLLETTGFPNTGYKLTRNLRATSGIKLPGWASRVQSSWTSMQSSWIGYVAVCQDKAEITRLGRRDVVISLRGTATCLEWLENLRATLAPIPGARDGPVSTPMVESGFLSLYTSGSESLQDSIREEVGRILDQYPNQPLSITLTGHSLGAALATLAAHDIKTTFKRRAPLVTVMSFGGPRVGNRSFRSLIEKEGIKILRIVNPNDLITKIPGIIVDNNDDNDNNGDHDENERNLFNIPDSNHKDENLQTGRFSFGFEFGFGFGFGFSFGFWSDWIRKHVENTQTQWAYAEVGCELRLESQEKPKYEIKYLAKCHDLKTYLKLLSSKCPLRARASTFLRRS